MSFGSKVNDDHQDILYEFSKILYATGVSSNEKAKISSYQLKDVDQTLYNHCRDNRSLRAAIVTFEVF